MLTLHTLYCKVKSISRNPGHLKVFFRSSLQDCLFKYNSQHFRIPEATI